MSNIRYRDSYFMKVETLEGVQWPPNDTSEKKLLIGTTAIAGDLHWALKIGVLWFEVVGKDSGSSRTQLLQIHDDDTNYGTNIFSLEASTPATYEDLYGWCITWTKTHPNYELTGANCQKFVQEFTQCISGTKLATQNMVKGQEFKLASAVASGIAVGGAILAAILYGIGEVIQGSH